jgi:manganese-dependent ADP-ribose/CDP-alcohol diphosphatase
MASSSPVRAAGAAADAAAAAASGDERGEPAFRFGLLADIQYTDTEDRCNHTGTQWRRYRNSLLVAANAVEYFNAHELDFVIHNGDIIDHQCAFDFAADAFRPKSEGLDQLGDVMRVLSDARCKDWIFTVGNHELYNFSREDLRDGVLAPGATLPFKCANAAGDFHYAVHPAPGWRVLVLDAYDVSIYRRGREQGLDVAALELLCAHNDNCAKWVADNPQVVETERMSGTFPYFKDLEGLDNRWVPFNGRVCGGTWGGVDVGGCGCGLDERRPARATSALRAQARPPGELEAPLRPDRETQLAPAIQFLRGGTARERVYVITRRRRQ